MTLRQWPVFPGDASEQLREGFVKDSWPQPCRAADLIRDHASLFSGLAPCFADP